MFRLVARPEGSERAMQTLNVEGVEELVRVATSTLERHPGAPTHQFALPR